MTRFTQIIAMPWKDRMGHLNSSLYALGADGKVYRYRPSTDLFDEIGKGAGKKSSESKVRVSRDNARIDDDALDDRMF